MMMLCHRERQRERGRERERERERESERASEREREREREREKNLGGFQAVVNQDADGGKTSILTHILKSQCPTSMYKATT